MMIVSQQGERLMRRFIRGAALAGATIAGATIAGASCQAAAPPGPITAGTAWFRYLLPQIPAGGFVTLHNSGAKPVVLDGVTTSACGMAMLHKSVNHSGVDRMVMVDRVTISAHGSFSFSPGAYHIMCMQPKMKPGEIVTVSLSFQNAPQLDIPFKVYGADGKPGTK
jgi:copper(I)-binding protein